MIARYALRTPLGGLVVEWSDRGLACLSFGLRRYFCHRGHRGHRERLVAPSSVDSVPSVAGSSVVVFGKAKRGPRLPVLKGQEGARGEMFLAELARYFDRGEWRFSVPLDLSGGTDFDREVWRALRAIPAGKVRTYGEIARAIGSARAARAVGNACGRNPVAIVVPCHRVVAAGGIGGFGAGLGVKRRLLALEGVSV